VPEYCKSCLLWRRCAFCCIKLLHNGSQIIQSVAYCPCTLITIYNVMGLSLSRNSTVDGRRAKYMRFIRDTRAWQRLVLFITCRYSHAVYRKIIDDELAACMYLEGWLSYYFVGGKNRTLNIVANILRGTRFRLFLDLHQYNKKMMENKLSTSIFWAVHYAGLSSLTYLDHMYVLFCILSFHCIVLVGRAAQSV